MMEDRKPEWSSERKRRKNMSSEKAQYIIEMMRRGKNAPRQDEPVDYGKRRAFMESRHAQQKTASGVTYEQMTLNGVETECSIPSEMTGENIILYIHGGGFVTGNARTSRSYASYLAEASGLRVYAISYRLAPEHPYPAAPDDCFAVYRALIERHPGAKIALVGGSAGGNLCLVTALRAREEKMQMPAMLALYSPVTECSGNLPSRRINAQNDCTIRADIDRETQAVYSVDKDVYDPHISPLYGEFAEFPLVYVVVDRDEVLLDDSVLLTSYAARDGIETELQMTEGMFHDFPSMGPELPEAAQVMEHTVELLHRCGM